MRIEMHALTLFSLAGLVLGTGLTAANAAEPTLPVKEQAQTNGAATGQSTAAAVTGKVMKLKLNSLNGLDYTVEHPTWRESKAVRVVDANRPHLNQTKTLFARLSVGAESEADLKRAISLAGAALQSDRPGSHSYRTFSGLDTVFIVEANSVEDAINMAAALENKPGILWTEIEHRNPVENKAITSDPSASEQWHIDNPGGNDNNVAAAYDRGITGSGVVIGILEADQNSFYHVDNLGVENIHPDLVNQINRDLSVPTDPFNISYSHGVSVAGLAAGEGNNGLAGSGVAYGAQLASLLNGSSINAGESFGHELNDIDIINNSWGPMNLTSPVSPTGKFLEALPDDFEIDIPQVTHAGMTRIEFIGLDQGLRLGRNGHGRIFVFSAGNGSSFQGFARLLTGNAISLPGLAGFNAPAPVTPYGYLDISGPDPTRADGDGDGVPDVFHIDGMVDAGWRWSGLMGDRVEYNSRATRARTFAIGSAGMSNALSGYSTTGCSVFASTYVQDTTLAQEFTPRPMGAGYGAASAGIGLVTLEQPGDGDTDSANCSTDFGAFNTSFVDPDLESCQFNGTSAAAPVASGIIALMLEANPTLTIRDVQHIIQQTSTPVNYDPTQSYWTVDAVGLGTSDPDDFPGNPPTFWTTNSGGVRHHDGYGFGIMDADAAVAAALTWENVSKSIILDSGLVDIAEEGNAFLADGEIADATYEKVAIISENLETNRLVPGAATNFIMSCVRDNLTVEGVELEVTIEGDGAGDLFIAIASPQGTISPLALPRGDSNGMSGNAYLNHTFSTYKHWGELSGGEWRLIIADFRSDEASPQGTAPADPPDPADLGQEQVTYLGTFGLPGNANHTAKTLVSYRLKIYGTDNGTPVFEGCPIALTACPGDLNGDGIVNLLDLQIFLHWHQSGNILADMNASGNLELNDIMIFLSIWQPGFCDQSTGLPGGRPTTGTLAKPTDPLVRPI